LVEARLSPDTLAILQALQFRDASVEGLAALNDRQWDDLLPRCDALQITLLLGSRCGEALPASARRQIAGRYRDFELRMTRIHRQLGAVADELHRENIPFAVLKGFSHAPDLCPDPILRAQGDIDLWFEPSTVHAAYAAMQRLGYRGGRPSEGKRHLPPLIMPQPFKWNGNFAEAPISFELHHQLWSEEAEYIGIPWLEDMWERRYRKPFHGRTYDVLALPDLVGFAALHFFVHLIHGDLPLQRLWEIAHILQSRAADEDFWQTCADLHSRELRRIETLVFVIAAGWFNCDLPLSVVEAKEELPDDVKLWLREFMFSPLRAKEDSNKDYLWLRLPMIARPLARAKVFFVTLFPLQLPEFIDPSDPEKRVPVLTNFAQRRTYLLARIKRHISAIVPTLRGAIAWLVKCGLRKGLRSIFLRKRFA
jgi:hypothetical protein